MSDGQQFPGPFGWLSALPEFGWEMSLTWLSGSIQLFSFKKSMDHFLSVTEINEEDKTFLQDDLLGRSDAVKFECFPA